MKVIMKEENRPTYFFDCLLSILMMETSVRLGHPFVTGVFLSHLARALSRIDADTSLGQKFEIRVGEK